jgi:hypothetical protein
MSALSNLRVELSKAGERRLKTGQQLCGQIAKLTLLIKDFRQNCG